MKEFAHGHKEFDIFKEKPAQKAALMSQLVRCTRKHVNKAFSASIVLKDWERLNQRYKMIEAWGPPYSFCALHCIEMVQMWARKNGIKYPVRFFFEDGAHQRGELKRLAKEQYKTEPTFPKKALATQLQCCDLLAWKNRKALDAAVTRGGTRDIEDMRSVLRSLEEVNKIANRYGAHDYKSLVKVCQLKLEARSVKGS